MARRVLESQAASGAAKNASKADEGEEWPSGMFCPWCEGRDLVDGTKGIWCHPCERLAWIYTPTGIRRADYDHRDLVEIDPDDLDPCPECGSLELWESLTGNWRCQICDPPTKARALLQHTERIRHGRTESPRMHPKGGP